MPKVKRPPPKVGANTIGLSSGAVNALHELLREFYPDLTKADVERIDEILEAIPREDYRREDLICAIDQAYCEHRGMEPCLTRKSFAQ